ncbi:CDP-diacylglycerol--glycerol-3-phosphate 3-phosphatidyltransferase [hydrothermal vent metagenome]|uniref:CDP-diacylglycerol--glycerol-3-phosphate 3-phosphatidyltransferase n=1 Tax=hydrothermal vent metagenome TaxID=652676 RepID=A0A3B1E246_9ZZZZ
MTQSDNRPNTTPPQPQRVQPIGSESFNLPNCITISRLFLSVILFWLIWYDGYWITAAVLFVVAAATDALDGYLARRYGQVTTLGRILDPFADKIIVCGTFVFLLDRKVSPSQEILESGVNAWMVVIVIAREMFVTSLRGFLEKHGLDFSANWIGKAKMMLQCIAITGSLLSLSPSVQRVAGENFNLWRDGFLWAMVIVTVYSGVAYVIRAMQLLRQNANE